MIIGIIFIIRAYISFVGYIRNIIITIINIINTTTTIIISSNIRGTRIM